MKNILLTPGPLTTSNVVKQSMQKDLGTRDKDYENLVEETRQLLLEIANADPLKYSVIFMQGSGTFGVESVLTSTIQPNEKVLILSNGAYGDRMGNICKQASVNYKLVQYSMVEKLNSQVIEKEISKSDITHVAYVHCETTAGVLNDIEEIQNLIHKYKKISIVDAMSSFASIPISINKLGVDYLITSSNKCLHGVPGLAIVFANKKHLSTCKNICHSLSLDLYSQYEYMEQHPGSFRFTSPTHVMLALNTAIKELISQGGIKARYFHYLEIQKLIHEVMSSHKFDTLVCKADQCPVITTFLYKQNFNFQDFYNYFKKNGFILYNGKLTDYDAFRIGNIGDITKNDIQVFKKVLDHYFEEVK